MNEDTTNRGGKSTVNSKQLVVSKASEVDKLDDEHVFWMTENEFVRIIAGRESTNSEYVITDGIIEPNSFVPDHYHKWEDQTFHVMEGELEAKIGDELYQIKAGDSIHCPRGISHFFKNTGSINARILSYIFPGDWAEDFFRESSQQTKAGKLDLQLIEDKFGVVYV